MVIRVKKDSQHRHKLTKKAYRISLNRQTPNANNSVIDIHTVQLDGKREGAMLLLSN